ncbi:FkbM family methyltransferase [Desulfuromonas sp. KJ2020]|uniref:FkbM family methyltransferase n=1 Tax=Desulfuromonas sp. KJ2020 TaxID=2919173 RepID=UPI0020A7F8AE|nr:FkbM family methyltransferase [Desulfuromonas sp. KJ2020]
MEKKIKIADRDYIVSSDDNYLNAVGSVFEPYMVKLFQSVVGPDDVVADIGGNIGLTAILFSTLAKYVYAFEPSSTTFNILKNNIARTGFTNIEAINLGLGVEKQSVTLTFAKNNRSGGYVSNKIMPEGGHITETVNIETLDDYFETKRPIPTFLKIDVEGFEKNVIEGGGKLIKKYQPTVVMEMNHFCLDVLQRITIPDFLDFMRGVFPYLYAVDSDNMSVVNLHVPDQAYMVMYEHVVNRRYPNIVGFFKKEIKEKLKKLVLVEERSIGKKLFETPEVQEPLGSIISKNVMKLPLLLNPGEVFLIDLELRNSSKEKWYSYGSKPIFISYHWYKTEGDTVIYDGVRSVLSKEFIAPSTYSTECAKIIAPTEKGEYNLIVTLVQEGVSWLESRGFEPVMIKTIVS